MSTKHPIRILLVDDDHIFRFTTQKLLKSLGLDVDVLELQNGWEALYYLEAHHAERRRLPNVIFLDLNVPVNGWEFLDAFAMATISPKKLVSN